MAAEEVRIHRPAGQERVLLMAGHTTRYAVEPRGEYVFGIVAAQPMRARRGRERRLVEPGHLVAWDPSSAHAGESATGRPWAARLMIVEPADLAELAGGEDDDPLARVAFPAPVLTDPALATQFLRLHRALEGPATRLERDERLAVWLRALVTRHSTARPRPEPGSADERAVRLACAYLGDHPGRNVGLAELAAAAGADKFRLIRAFRRRTGLPPHAWHLAHRIRLARRLIESGRTLGDTAAATGFADQSHLHRQFRRGLGMTPGEYRSRLGG